jgi:hypothetical protein
VTRIVSEVFAAKLRCIAFTCSSELPAVRRVRLQRFDEHLASIRAPFGARTVTRVKIVLVRV